MSDWLVGWIPDSLAAVAYAGAGLALLSLFLAVLSARGRHGARFAAWSALGLVFLLLAGLSGAVALGIRGYRNLTQEQLAARIHIRPLGAQQFRARFEFPDGRRANFTLAGDELYVDAHILKWKWVANWFGLQTHYELDRVSGRYRDLEDERDRERTVYALAPERRIDLFQLARTQPRMAPILDAEYGSASFVPADRPAAYEVRVSATGLLIRPSSPRPGDL